MVTVGKKFRPLVKGGVIFSSKVIFLKSSDITPGLKGSECQKKVQMGGILGFVLPMCRVFGPPLVKSEKLPLGRKSTFKFLVLHNKFCSDLQMT